MSAPDPDALVSIVIPAYRSARTLPELVRRLEEVLGALDGGFEIIVVDDCSPDDTWAVLEQLKETRPYLKIVRLLRNSGQHNALICGFSLSNGDIVVTMDDDLQNPPEEVPKLIVAMDEGVDLAIGAYQAKQHSRGRNLGGSMIDWIQRRIFALPRDFQLTSFRAVRKVVIDRVVEMSGVYPYVTSMLLSHAGRCANVLVRHDPRSSGTSNYNIKRSVGLALNLLLSYSSYPLYTVLTLCLAALTFSALLSAWVIWQTLIAESSVPGWASTIVAISLFNGLILLALVIQGLYLSRLTRQISRSRVGFTIGEMHD